VVPSLHTGSFDQDITTSHMKLAMEGLHDAHITACYGVFNVFEGTLGAVLLPHARP